ncbi:hypothetical protein EH165_02820 [Nakamurella antarctica]|uniref:Uncharacterized protein n=1 Tax=Nakamurella antarctica TaxID=1902245 RepID=A0A3G8ZJ58_9ACTN|nr:hypothetical protein [Nakamurella antarctica]AZI57250.1 hypothetical protein EH165_02820 [Nakamurella antarctica]
MEKGGITGGPPRAELGASPRSGPGWKAIEIGPGGLDPARMRPIYSAPTNPVAVHSVTAAPSGDAPTVARHEKFALYAHGSQELAPLSRWQRIRSSEHLATGVIASIVLVLVVAVVWATAAASKKVVDKIAVGECLSDGGFSVSEVGCETVDASYRVVERIDDSSDYTRCDNAFADAVLSAESAILCVNYVVRVGDCLQMRERSKLGTLPCGSANASDVYEVTAVLGNTVDSADCPAVTDQVLVHPKQFEVICLRAVR